MLVLHVGPTEVSALAATGLAVGAAVALPLGPWVEFRRKRPVMIAMDLLRGPADRPGGPVVAARRLTRTPPDRVARTLTARSVTGKLTTAAMTALWGLLATVTTPRTAIATAGLLLLAAPLLLPSRRTDNSLDLMLEVAPWSP